MVFQGRPVYALVKAHKTEARHRDGLPSHLERPVAEGEAFLKVFPCILQVAPAIQGGAVVNINSALDIWVARFFDAFQDSLAMFAGGRYFSSEHVRICQVRFRKGNPHWAPGQFAQLKTLVAALQRFLE